jgi:hypothetical protein
MTVMHSVAKELNIAITLWIYIPEMLGLNFDWDMSYCGGTM